MMRRAASLLAALLVSACGAPQRFQINDQVQAVGPVQLAGMSAAWTNDARSVFRGSRTDAGTVDWIVNFIAVSETQGTAGMQPCRSLTALQLTPRETKPFKIFDMGLRAAREYSPREYNEAWLVDACGKIREWRVFDDPKDARNPLTVILWHDGNGPRPPE